RRGNTHERVRVSQPGSLPHPIALRSWLWRRSDGKGGFTERRCQPTRLPLECPESRDLSARVPERDRGHTQRGCRALASTICSIMLQYDVIMVRLGGAASPTYISVFRGLKAHFLRHGIELDWVLYSDYDALVEAFVRREIDLAWNAPLAYVKIKRRLQ